MITLNTMANFCWGFGQDWLLTVEENGKYSYYVWSDSEYNGDNTIRPYTDNPCDFVHKGFAGRDKGTHEVKRYCGEHVIILEE